MHLTVSPATLLTQPFVSNATLDLTTVMVSVWLVPATAPPANQPRSVLPSSILSVSPLLLPLLLLITSQPAIPVAGAAPTSTQHYAHTAPIVTISIPHPIFPPLATASPAIQAVTAPPAPLLTPHSAFHATVGPSSAINTHACNALSPVLPALNRNQLTALPARPDTSYLPTAVVLLSVVLVLVPALL
jgi:hypothetical protein